MDTATVKCHQCRFWLKRPGGEWGVCRPRSTEAGGIQFRTVLETAAAFGCGMGAAGDPNLPEGWDLDRLAVLVRAEKGGKAKLPKMLVMLEIVDNEGDGVILSKKKGVHLSRSLTDAGWKRANPRKSGSPWLPPHPPPQ